MPKCRNCGQPAVRTEDWACQWCGYPLLSKSYKKIAKTYRQLKEERLHVREEPQPVPEPEPEPIPEPEPVLEPEGEPVTESKPEPEPVPEPEPKVTVKPKAKAATKPKVKAAVKPKVKAAVKPKAKAAVKPKAKAVTKPKTRAVTKPEPVPESGPEPAPAAIDITVEGLLSAYEEQGVAADAKFVNKILNVTGVVDRIEVKDILNIYYITLTNAEKNLLQGVRCVFDREYGAELNQLTIGQAVTVQGKYDGSIMDICMRDCVLVR